MGFNIQEDVQLAEAADNKLLERRLYQTKRTLEELEKHERSYFDQEKNEQAVDQYYEALHFEEIDEVSTLLQTTHTQKLRYDPSEYVYPWVDLRPDGKLTSIYSGQTRQPEEVVKADHATSMKRKEALAQVEDAQDSEEAALQIMAAYKYNCEHAVPQSWFDGAEPMRGDLHHLFTCEPLCNSIRSNYPFHDFADYPAENATVKRIEDQCGKADEHLFEPEFGKGTVARATLYFLLRYPDKIEHAHKEKIKLALLLEWHRDFPPTVYEQHRNQAIYEIQGNRNPFIDFPEKMADLYETCVTRG
ncbi:endonuclease I family protein [Thalassobacillus sp. CUG 92003]|uniref:endonuclease I family protein n=1 Tax=Thalassobacillus sp. CUG 92003 TaxID=2736641 RepID=UPI0015E6A001|nr:endonuclease [Thalassobacillus sp. CUG 92003]